VSGLVGHRGQLEQFKPGAGAWKRDHQSPAHRPDPLKHPGHVAPRIFAIGLGLLLIAKGDAAEEYQPGRQIILPQAAGRAFGAGLLDDG
jgi:hypothetical protein